MVTPIVLNRAETDRVPDLTDAMNGNVGLRVGIVETEAMIAFRAFSWQELESGFELGSD